MNDLEKKMEEKKAKIMQIQAHAQQARQAVATK
jgi:hypothetical protein